MLPPVGNVDTKSMNGLCLVCFGMENVHMGNGEKSYPEIADDSQQN